MNPEFAPLEIEPEAAADVVVVGEFVRLASQV